MIDLITATVEGADEATRRLDTVVDLIRDRIVHALERVGQQVASTASGMAPKDKGTMAGLIKARLQESKDSLSEKITVPFPGILMEFGVKYGARDDRGVKEMRRVLKQHGIWRIEPRPFLRPALHSVNGFVEAVLLQAIQDVVKGDA